MGLYHKAKGSQSAVYFQAAAMNPIDIIPSLIL